MLMEHGGTSVFQHIRMSQVLAGKIRMKEGQELPVFYDSCEQIEKTRFVSIFLNLICRQPEVAV